MHEEMDPKEKVSRGCHDLSRSLEMHQRMQSGVSEGALGALGTSAMVH